MFYDLHAGPWTLLVGHDGDFKVALLALLGLPLDRFWTFTQATTGIAVLDIRSGRTVLRAWNRTQIRGAGDRGRRGRTAGRGRSGRAFPQRRALGIAA